MPSSHTDRPLRDVAREVVATGRLPVDPVEDPIAEVQSQDGIIDGHTLPGARESDLQSRLREIDVDGGRTEETAARARAAAENVHRLADEAHQRARDSHLRASEMHRRATEARDTTGERGEADEAVRD